MDRTPFIGAVMIAAALLGGAGCARTSPLPASAPAAAQPSAKTAERAPAFRLQNYGGQTVSLDEFKGKPLVINSWAAWCPFCRKELPDFAAVQKEFAGRITFIAIDRAESRDTAKQFTDQLGVTTGMVFLLDPDDTFYRSIGGFSMPETIFVDREGVIRHHQRGPLTAEDTRGLVQSLLAEDAAASPAAYGEKKEAGEATIGVRISFTGSSFHPSSARIKRGQTVTFVNESSQSVRITSSGFAPSTELGSEGNYTVKLTTTAGVVSYSNALDPKSAGGEIVVE